MSIGLNQILFMQDNFFNEIRQHVHPWFVIPITRLHSVTSNYSLVDNLKMKLLPLHMTAFLKLLPHKQRILCCLCKKCSTTPHFQINH